MYRHSKTEKGGNKAVSVNTSTPAVETVDLTCTRGGEQILDIERLRFPQHSIVAVIGDNGSGKSTITEALCGVGAADGNIALNGIYMNIKERASKCFMVMQDVNRQLFLESVMEEVMLNSSADRAKAEDILDRLGLKDVTQRHPSSLSGGQKQRVAIASALCAGKEILFYDSNT